MLAVEPNHLTGAQAQPDTRRRGRRTAPGSILPHDRVHSARAALRHKEGDDAPPANGGKDGFIRSDGTEIGDVFVGGSRRAKGGKGSEGRNRGEGGTAKAVTAA